MDRTARNKQIVEAIERQIPAVRSDPRLAREYLQATGMYGEDGGLKAEFKGPARAKRNRAA